MSLLITKIVEDAATIDAKKQEKEHLEAVTAAKLQSLKKLRRSSPKTFKSDYRLATIYANIPKKIEERIIINAVMRRWAEASALFTIARNRKEKVETIAPEVSKKILIATEFEKLKVRQKCKNPGFLQNDYEGVQDYYQLSQFESVAKITDETFLKYAKSRAREII